LVLWTVRRSLRVEGSWRRDQRGDRRQRGA
jgi:hypothetical protein